MARKRRPLPPPQPSPPQPPAVLSEVEEEEVESHSGKGSEEERSGKQAQSKALNDDDNDDSNDSGEEDSEPEPEQPTLNRPRSASATPIVPTPATPAVASDDDDDDDDDEGDESGESEEEQPVPNPPAPPSVTSGKPSNGDALTESGKDSASPPKTATGESVKKSSGRIWSDVDQLTLLKGMVDYIETEGKDPLFHIEGFWLFIRKKLCFSVSERQLAKKIRMVKSKYKSKQGKNRVFSKAYDAEVFELSKKVWGAGEKSVVIENGSGKKRKVDELEAGAGEVVVSEIDEVEWENETVNLSMKHMGLSEGIARAKIKSLPEAERKMFVQSWKKLKEDAVSTLIRRTLLEIETFKTIF